MISVVVPTHNEERLLSQCLESVAAQHEPCQLIVSDGASEDDTVRVARQYTNLVIHNKQADLPAQLNTGAKAASGEILLFLHADSRLSPGCLSRLSRLPSNIRGGAFTMQVEGRRFFYRILSLGGDLYCRMTGTYFGDRGMFVRTETFHDLGGFVSLPIMTDVDFSRRLKRAGKTVLLPGPVITSGRKFDRESWWQILYRIVRALLDYRLKTDPERIKTRYYGTR